MVNSIMRGRTWFSFPWLFVFFFFSVVLLAIPEDSHAIPAFAKKYSAPCSLCHSSWPQLNDTGWRFKFNGYQLPDGYDGGKASKVSPSFDLHLDVGNANPPISFRFNGGIDLIQPKLGPGGYQDNGMFCCTEGNNFHFNSGGTVRENAGYFVAHRFGDSQVEEAYMRLVNWFGHGYMGVDLGAFNTADFDVISARRDWFSEPNAALFGNLSPWGGAKGVGLGYTHTGARLYGNPNYGMFSYELLYVTGGRDSGLASRSKSKAMSAMGRMTIGKFMASAKFWNAETSNLTFRRVSDGTFISGFDGVGDFSPNPLLADEATQNYYLGARYAADTWDLELSYAYGYFKADPRTSGGNTLSMDSIKRHGFSLAGIYRFSSMVTFGARYGYSATSAYQETYNGVVTSVPGANITNLELKLQLTPVQNAKLALGMSFDKSNPYARKTIDGNGNVFTYNLQNKVFLLWDWAI